jgi:hypothetical protein
MHDVLDWLSENEAMVNELKGPRGQLGFQLAGHNSCRISERQRANQIFATV